MAQCTYLIVFKPPSILVKPEYKAMQSFGDFLGFNPHLHILRTDGCFYVTVARLETKAIEETWQPCAHTSPIEENKWFATMDITAMSSEVKEKNKVRMNGRPLSWNRTLRESEFICSRPQGDSHNIMGYLVH
jgi:hypothetical protein